MSEILNQCRAVTGVPSTAGTSQPVQTVAFDPASIEEYVGLIEAALPNAEANLKAIEGAWTYADGSRAVLYAVKQTHPVKASVTLYRNGKAVFAGIAPVAVPVPAPEAEAEAEAEA